MQRLTEVLARLDILDPSVRNVALEPILSRLEGSVEDIRSSLVDRNQSGRASLSQEPFNSALAANKASQAVRGLQQVELSSRFGFLFS